MKILSNILDKFVKKASLNGSITSINLEFKEDGLHSSVKSVDNVALTRVFLPAKAFGDYTAMGEIFVKDAVTFSKYLKTFSEVVSLELCNEYMLKITGESRDALVMLGAEIVCENVWRKDLPTIPVTERVLVSKDQLARTVSDVSLLKINQVVIKKTKDKLVFEVGQQDESDFFVNTVETREQSNGEATVKLGTMFATLYSVLDGDVEIKLGNDVPIIAFEKKDDMEFTCLIAPVVESKD